MKWHLSFGRSALRGSLGSCCASRNREPAAVRRRRGYPAAVQPLRRSSRRSLLDDLLGLLDDLFGLLGGFHGELQPLLGRLLSRLQPLLGRLLGGPQRRLGVVERREKEVLISSGELLAEISEALLLLASALHKDLRRAAVLLRLVLQRPDAAG